ncbi:uncharacterized protein LOC135476894 [Liolophura sinensis]|uniref:uncharacterized protein LOC135476894 n=1 Tax=Liolophura sinensis TaxID=3198878 RepID=UPI003158EB8D
MTSHPSIHVEKWDAAKDGVLSEESMRKKLRAQGYNCIRYEFSPGTVFPDHTHNISKKDSILTGRFKFAMYGQEVVLEPGDMVEVPAKTVHNAAVVGSKSVVFFDATK